MEIWKDIKGYEGYYQISNLGRVKSLRSNKLLKPALDRGYSYVVLCVKMKSKKYKIHRLIAIHFIPNYHNKPHINHIDGNKRNNDISNLEWCTNDENRKHAAAIGLMVRGSKHYFAKLTEDNVRYIKKAYANKEISQNKLAIKFGVHRKTIYDIIIGKQWKHVE